MIVSPGARPTAQRPQRRTHFRSCVHSAHAQNRLISKLRHAVRVAELVAGCPFIKPTRKHARDVTLRRRHRGELFGRDLPRGLSQFTYIVVRRIRAASQIAWFDLRAPLDTVRSAERHDKAIITARSDQAAAPVQRRRAEGVQLDWFACLELYTIHFFVRLFGTVRVVTR